MKALRAFAFRIAVCLAGSTMVPGAFAQALPAGALASNVQAVGYSDLNGLNEGFKMSIIERNGRWYLYVGHFWHRGWSIVDVTDPARPRVVKFLAGPENTSTGQVDIADGKMITGLERKRPDWGGDDKLPAGEGVLIWGLDDPENPKLLGHYKTGGGGTHRNFYGGGRYMHLTAAMPGYRGAIYVIVDISDPAKPVEAGRWWVPGQHVAGGETPKPSVTLHGPAYVVGNLVYLPYAAAGMIILDISDVAHPKLVGQLPFTPPFLGFFGVHSILPFPARKIAMTNSEAVEEDCREPLNQASIVDIANPAKPVLLSLFPVPVPPPGLPYTNFCDKGGRFGPHNVNQHHHNPFVDHSDTLVTLTYFNAGLRIYNIADPRLPREVGWFIPPDPAKRMGPKPVNKLVEQTEDVLVDKRGNIYITHKNQGLWILRYTGPK